MTWQFAGSSYEGDPLSIDEIDVWQHRWKTVDGRRETVVDPQSGQNFDFPVYEVADHKKTVRFAAGEFANGVWGFFCED